MSPESHTLSPSFLYTGVVPLRAHGKSVYASRMTNNENWVYIGFRVHPGLKKRLQLLADQEHRTLSNLCSRVLIQHLEKVDDPQSTALNGGGHKLASERSNSRGAVYRPNK